MAQSNPSARLEARVPAEVHALLKRAADLQGRTMTDFVVATAVEEARRVISEHDVIRLSLEDQRAVAEALANPPEPTDALRRAFARRRDLLGLE
jgi:uncharacterized protein (DUF1778 family)